MAESSVLSTNASEMVVPDGAFHRATGLPANVKMAPGLAVFFDDALYNRCKSIASIMAEADGVMPRHLVGKKAACFAVVSRAITWNLDPMAVAMATYQTPGGQIGYMGVLIQSILENSGYLEGNKVHYAFEGDWTKVQRKFAIKESPKGGKYAVPTWTEKDAEGLSVIVSATLKGDLEPRVLPFSLLEAFPLNSPLWATAPNRQIRYTAVRAFANLEMPGIIMGVPFDVDPSGFYGEPMDINDRPARAAAKQPFLRKTADEVPAKDPAAEAQGGASAADGKPAPETQAQADQGGQPAQAEPEEAKTAEGEVHVPTEDESKGAAAAEAEGAAVVAETPEARYAELLALLKQQGRIGDVSDLQKAGVLEFEETAPDMVSAWIKACEARNFEIVDESRKTRGKR